jgi:hypothetical protein
MTHSSLMSSGLPGGAVQPVVKQQWDMLVMVMCMHATSSLCHYLDLNDVSIP